MVVGHLANSREIKNGDNEVPAGVVASLFVFFFYFVANETLSAVMTQHLLHVDAAASTSSTNDDETRERERERERVKWSSRPAKNDVGIAAPRLKVADSESSSPITQRQKRRLDGPSCWAGGPVFINLSSHITVDILCYYYSPIYDSRVYIERGEGKSREMRGWDHPSGKIDSRVVTVDLSVYTPDRPDRPDRPNWMKKRRKNKCSAPL